jgi:acyl-coenzyme A thioesterase PaaI-like protein
MRSLKDNIRFLKWYPPFLGSGIKMESYNESFTRLVVVMKMRWWNRNLVGTHFGGSLYSMCDPFYMFILMENLGKDYIVWDKAATIRFKKPGTGTVKAIFEIPAERMDEIKKEVDMIGKNDYIFQTVVTHENGDVVAEVEKTVYVRKKEFKKV